MNVNTNADANVGWGSYFRRRDFLAAGAVTGGVFDISRRADLKRFLIGKSLVSTLSPSGDFRLGWRFTTRSGTSFFGGDASESSDGVRFRFLLKTRLDDGNGIGSVGLTSSDESLYSTESALSMADRNRSYTSSDLYADPGSGMGDEYSGFNCQKMA